MDSGPNPDRTTTARPGTGRLAAAAAALVVLVAATALALPGELVAGERPAFRAVNDLPGVPRAVTEVAMAPGTTLGALALAAVALAARRRRLALGLALAWLLAWTGTKLLKAVVDRPRPPGLLADVALRTPLPDEPGFPSSHTGTAVALAVVAAAWWPRRWWLGALGAAAVALARVYVGVHLPLDLVGGAAIGLLAGLGARAIAPRLPRSEPRGAHRRTSPASEPT